MVYVIHGSLGTGVDDLQWLERHQLSWKMAGILKQKVCGHRFKTNFYISEHLVFFYYLFTYAQLSYRTTKLHIF